MTTPPLAGRVLAVCAGGVATLPNGRRGIRSGFLKSPLAGPVEVGPLGLPGDAHVYRHHGGPDMALCVYPAEHLPHWRATGLELPDAGAFGENLTTTGLVETDVCVGDVFTCGTAVVQVSQPRSPCGKISARHGRQGLDRALARAGHVGWLLRVLRPGVVRAGDTLVLTDRSAAAVTVAEAGRVLDVDRRDVAGVPAVLASPGLADAAAEVLRTRLARHAARTRSGTAPTAADGG